MDNSSGVLQKLKFTSGEVTSCDMNANYLLTIGLSDGSVRVLEWKAGLGFVDMFYSPLYYHKYKITSVRFSPKGVMLASSSLDGTATLLDVLTGTKIFTMVQHNKSNVKFCEFTFDCTKALTAADDGILCFWDLLHQRQIRHFHLHENDFGLTSLTLSPDSEYLVSMDSTDLLKLWYIGDVINSEPRCVLLNRDVHKDNSCCQFSPVVNISGFFLLKLEYSIVTCGADGVIKVWDLVIERNQKFKRNLEHIKCSLTAINVVKEHVSDIISVRFNPTGNFVVSTGLDNLVKLWEVRTGKCLKTFLEHTAFVTSAAFSKDSVFMITGSTNSVLIIWDLSENLTLDSHLIVPCNVSCHFTHIKLMNYCTGSADKYQTQKLEFTLLQRLNSSSIVTCVQFQNKDILAIAGWEKTITLWERRESTSLYEIKDILKKYKYSINCMDTSSCGNKIIFCSVDGLVLLRDLNMNLTYEMRSPNCIGSLRTCKFFPDAKFITAAGDDKEIYLWDATTLEFMKIIQKHENAVTAIAFTPDGKYLLSACDGGHILLQNLEQENCTCSINNAHDLGVTCCDFSSAVISKEECTQVNFKSLKDNCSKVYLLATSGKDCFVKLWGVGCSEIFMLNAFTGHGATVNYVKFSPSEPFIFASCSSDTTVRIWHAKTKQSLQVLNFHTSAVTACSFSSDSALFATGSLDKTVLIFNVTGQFYLESAAPNLNNSGNKSLKNWNTSDVSNCSLGMGWPEETVELDAGSLLTAENATEEDQIALELQGLCIKKDLCFFFPGLQYKGKNVPHMFLCPLTHEIMMDPVICSDGFIYEGAAIAEWFLSRKFISPVTKENLKSTKLLKYSALKINIRKFLHENEKL